MITEKVKVYAKTVEDTAAAQIKEMSECEAYKDCTVRIMPDCHAGAGCTVAAKFSRQFSDEVSWMKVDPQAAAAASGEEDITEGGDGQGGGGNNNNPPSGELEG